MRSVALMDPRQQSQDYSGGSNSQRAGTNYGFNGIQNDPFNTFVNTDNDSAFEPSWTNQTLPAQQQQINSFDQGSHSWQQSPYQSSTFLGTTNYGPPRDYEQPYTRSPSSFNYPSFDPSHNSTFAPNTFDTPANPYDDSLYGQLNNSAHFDYAGSAELQQHHATISPQALQTYPSSFNHSAADDNQQVSKNESAIMWPIVISLVANERQSHQAHYGTNLPVRQASATAPGLHTGPNWASLAGATSASISARGLHIKPTAGLSSATKSTRIDGFVFVGNSKQSSGPIKGGYPKFNFGLLPVLISFIVKVARNDRKRSLKAIRRIFETGK